MEQNDNDYFDTDLNDAERERLALLLEECGEVQQIIGKIFRHGFGSYSPFDPKQTTNRKLLEKEVGDLLVAIDLMKTTDIDRFEIEKNSNIKRGKINRYLHFNKV